MSDNISRDKVKELIERLAKYHNAKFIDDEPENGLYFRFSCFNEVITWDKIDSNGHAAYNAHVVTNEKMFLDNYIGKHMFFRPPVQRFDRWSKDFNMFGSRMIRASSYEELELKLAMRGY